MDTATCPHCGMEVHGTKIKCGHCGQMLSAPPAPEEKGAGGVIMRGGDKRGVSVASGAQRGELTFETGTDLVVDITERVQGFVRGIGGGGLVHVYVPHATAAVALMEVGSGSEADLQAALERLFPSGESYTHEHGSPGHGRDHIIPVFMSSSVTIPCDHGSPLLGQWQRVVLIDPNRDNPQRRVLLSFISGRD
jgi:secondary thiamine-phosphate synthase enzyme